jgi:hypothetical protein
MSKSQERRKANQESEEEKKAREMVETIACEIAKLSRQVSALLTGRLDRKAVVILLASMTQMPQATVKQVLEAIEGMEAKYLKK